MTPVWTPLPELPWLWAGVACVFVATALAWRGVLAAARPMPRITRWAWLEAAVALLAVGIAVRWQRLGHGPFLDLFEILASSLFSLGLIAACAFRRDALLRAAAPPVLALLAVLGLWLLRVDAADTHFPPTYDTPVLWFHVLLGKMFLGCSLLALGLASALLLRRVQPARWLLALPDDERLDAAAWRVMQVALLFESAMLIAGAVWARDAWGRYWAWDPLETWAFLTWLLLVGGLHARRSLRLPPAAGASLVLAVFALAFLTFFGVPFVSVAPHKGAV
jgi:ABC-type transport system involved in cytochrome c biogenesis permease subunit